MFRGSMAVGVLAMGFILQPSAQAVADGCSYATDCTTPTDVYLRVSTSEVHESWNPSERLGPYLHGALVDPLRYRREPVRYVSSVAQFRDLLKSMAAQCKRVAVMDFVSHGDPGSARITEGEYLTADSMRRELTGLSCVMAPGAKLIFSGCNIGRGCRGSDFMVEAGRTLLGGRGGEVVAPNQFAYTAFAIPGDVIPNVMKFDAKGEPVERNFEIPDAGVCADRMSRLKARLEDLRDRDQCTFNGESVHDVRKAVERDLTLALEAYRSGPLSAPGSRERSSPELRAMDPVMETAVYSAEVLLHNAGDFQCGER